MTATTIIAISKAQEDEATGAVAQYHVIDYYAIDRRSAISTATVNGYISRKAYESGKQPVTSHTTSISGLPESDCHVLQWLYQHITAPVAPGAGEHAEGMTPNPFAGATCVLADNSIQQH